MFLDSGGNKEVEAISTKSLGLDIALGIGGLPRGRVIEIYGQESSGKTTLAQYVIAEAQKKGITCAFIDAEHSFDKSRAEQLGVDTKNLLISQPDYGEQALEVADRLVATGMVGVIVVDSVSALVPKGELEGEMGDSKMGAQARLMSQALRKLIGGVYKNNVVLIFINQLREKIGVMFGNPETTTGGNALKFYASVRLDVRKSTPIKDGDSIIGHRVKVKVVKNKVAPPFKVAEYDFHFDKGIRTDLEVVDIGVSLGILEKSGSWYAYNGDKLGQGREQVGQLLSDNENLLKEIKQKILMKIMN